MPSHFSLLYYIYNNINPCIKYSFNTFYSSSPKILFEIRCRPIEYNVVASDLDEEPQQNAETFTLMGFDFVKIYASCKNPGNKVSRQ